MNMRRLLTAGALALLLASPLALGQGVTTPPSGDNQKAKVTQWIGLVKVSVDYSSPDVTGPSGEDRRGKIWGKLVPYGMTDLGFGTCGKECPWRAGANENTVFEVSHDVKVEGKPLPKGRYGLHMIPGETEWVVIFSKNSTSWGSYFYDAKEDALRVTVKPQKAAYTHWLTYDFTDRQGDKATVAMKWEELAVPFTISVDNAVDLWVENMRNELRSRPGFSEEGWETAARFCLDKKTNLKEALAWAEKAAHDRFNGKETFSTLRTLADLQAANGMAADAEKTMKQAMEHPTATRLDLHQYGRSLLAKGEKEKALAVFELNAKRNPGAWPVDVGLMRGYAAVGKPKEALKHAKLALEKAPDEMNKKNIAKMIELLEAGKPLP